MIENKKISIKAILIGFATDVIGSIAMGVIFGIILGIVLAVRGVSPEKMAAQMEGPLVLIPSLVIGFLFTFIGGFVAGRIAKQAEVLNAGIVGGLGIFFGLLFCMFNPLWYNVISFVGVIPIAIFGGSLASLTKNKGELIQTED